MTDDVRRPAELPTSIPTADRLDSWKEIGAYLKRDVTTVRRWEKREALPVHRHLHDRRESVYAYRNELDRWWEARKPQLADKLQADTLGGLGRERLAWMSAGFLAMSTCALALLLLIRPLPDAPLERRAVQLAIPQAGPTGDFAFSPDGRSVAFVAGREGEARLWIRSLDSVTPVLVPGTESAATPFWSPDGRFLAFGADGKLRKVAVSGGAVHTLCEARNVIGGTWNRDDVIVFAPSNRTPLYRVAAAGGEPVQVTSLDESQGHNTHRWPTFLPDGRRFLYLARGTRPEDNGIYAGALDSPVTVRLVNAESSMAFAKPGFLVFARNRALLAQPLDLKTLRVTGEPIQILEDVLYSRDDSYAGFSVSDHGELAYQTSAALPRSTLAWFARSGQQLESANTLQDMEEPSLSGDGDRVAVSRWMGASRDIWLVDRAKGNSRLTSHPSVELMPIWSPDGDSIVFASNRDGPSDLYRMPSNGAGQAELIVKSGTVKHPTDWSQAAGVIVFESDDPKTGWDLWTLPLRAGGVATPFLQTEFAEGFGRLSPDGRWMAYVSNKSGANEIFVRPFPASPDGLTKISTAGGTQPRWRGDGSELFYLAADGKLMSVTVRTRPTFSAALPKALFETRPSQSGEWSYDVSRDGERFVFTVPVGDAAAAPIMVALDWIATISPARR